MSDVINVQSFVASDIGVALGTAMGQQLTLGTGTIQPSGFVTRAIVGAMTTVTSASGTGFFDWLDLASLFASVGPQYRESSQAAWMVSNSAFSKILKFHDANYPPLVVGDTLGGGAATLFGKPLYVNNAMNGGSAVASATLDVAFGDFSRFVVRQAPTRMDVSKEWLYGSDLISFRVITAIDSWLSDPDAVHTLQNANT